MSALVAGQRVRVRRSSHLGTVYYCQITKRLRAAKEHRCEGCRSPIAKGTVYLLHTAFPGHDAISGTRPQSARECAECATRSGRGALLDTKEDK